MLTNLKGVEMKNVFTREFKKANMKYTVERGTLFGDPVYFVMLSHYDGEIWIPTECITFYFDREEAIYNLIDYCVEKEINEDKIKLEDEEKSISNVELI